MERGKILESTAQRYRLMAGTITDRDVAQRLLDYAEELSGKAASLLREERRAAAAGPLPASIAPSRARPTNLPDER